MKYIYRLLLLLPVTTFAQDEIRLPHPPGPDNDETLLGIDSNNNNVRDDIEFFIKYRIGISDPDVFNAYMNYAESCQKRLMYRDNREILLEHDYQAHRDYHCVLKIDGSKNTKTKLTELYSEITNTRARARASAQMIKTIGNVEHKPIAPTETIQSLCRK